DYVSGPEHPPSLKFVPEPVYLEFMPSEDEVLPAEEQPLSAAVSPTADSLGYIPESDPDEDPEEDPADYCTDRDDDDDDDDDEDDDEESSEDEADDVEDAKDDDGDEEEHPAPADSILPPIVHRVTTKMSIREHPPTPIPSPPLPASPPLPVSSPPLPASPTYLLGYRVAIIRLRAETLSTSHPLSSSTPPLGTPPLLPIPLPTSSPLLLLTSTSHRADVPEVTLPPHKRSCIALGLRYEVDESSSAAAAKPTGGFRVDYGFVATLDDEIRRDPERDVGYGITDTWDEMLVGMPGAPATDA
nr:hypothetical protein [Tanacetum cinerariifolium]